MKIVQFVLGMLAGVVFVVVTGILSIQTSGRTMGALYNLNNEIVYVMNPGIASLQYVVFAGLFGLTLVVLTTGVLSDWKGHAAARLAGFSAALIALIPVAFVLAQARISSHQQFGMWPEGWRGWIDSGGTSAAMILMLMVALVLLVLRVRVMKSAADARQEPHDHVRSVENLPTRG